MNTMVMGDVRTKAARDNAQLELDLAGVDKFKLAMWAMKYGRALIDHCNDSEDDSVHQELLEAQEAVSDASDIGDEIGVQIDSLARKIDELKDLVVHDRLPLREIDIIEAKAKALSDMHG